ncbi:MAG: YerC/YecD family TrpR-related protein [Actinomycetota bacterium]
MPATHDQSWARTEDARSLIDAIITLDDRAGAQRFLRDLCTARELEEMIARWSVVRGLAQGTSYRALHDATGVSTATITRINDWVRNGTGGYNEALERLGLDQVGT